MNQTTLAYCIKRWFTRWIALGIALVTASNAAVLPPDQSYAGKTYPEWMAASWIYAWAIPWDGHHPVQDGTGADTLRDQSGPVWHLFAVGFPNPATKQIRVPQDQALFVTFDGVACSTVEPYPYDDPTEATLRTRFRLSPPFCEIDGMPVPDLNEFEFVSPMFDFYYPSNNIGGVPGSGWAQGMGRGTSILVHSLTPGLHTIHFRGGAGYDNNNSSWEVTYQITVYTRPSVTIRPVSGTNQFEVSWPVTDGFVLQETDSLSPNATWRTASVIATNLTSSIQSVTVTNASTNRFYRLKGN